jgi:hypothetical protein
MKKPWKMCFIVALEEIKILVIIFVKWMKMKENKRQQEHKNIHVYSTYNNKQH